MGLVVLAAAVLTIWRWIDSQRGWSVPRLEASIKAEIPLGADRRTVEKWFDAHGIPHSYFTDTTADSLGGSTAATLAGLRDEDLGGTVRGLIDEPEANLGFLRSGEIWIYFFLDKHGRVVGHLVHPFVYSP